MSGMGFGGTTSDPSITNLEDPAKPLTLTFHYHCIKEKDWGENRITAAFAPISLPAFTEDHPAVIPIDLGTPRTETSSIDVALPKGWTAAKPDTVHAYTAFATCEVTWNLTNGAIHAERNLIILKRKVPVSQQKQYQSWADECGVNSYPYIQLLPPPKAVSAATLEAPKPPADTATASAIAKPSDADAAANVQKAFESLRAMDLDAARTQLDAARATNPTQKGLWAGYATVAQLLGKVNELFDDLQQELRYHPDETALYPQLLAAYRQRGDTKAALALSQDWARNVPTSPEAQLARVTELQTSGQHAEALKAAHEAIRQLAAAGQNTDALQIAQANADTSLGHKREAATRLLALLNSPSLTVTQRNEAAYLIADSAPDIPDAATSLAAAQAAENTVLDTLAKTSSSWTANTPLQVASPTQQGLASSWDTMAWILYRQGKHREALVYSEAARRSHDNATLEQHYQAIRIALKLPPAHDSEQALRTYRLGPSRGHTGTSVYSLLIQAGKVTTFTRNDDNSTADMSYALTLLPTLDLSRLTPPPQSVQLRRDAFLNCHQDVCELLLTPLQ
jgi:tetratricopeptide (TPR) repeat protein